MVIYQQCGASKCRSIAAMQNLCGAIRFGNVQTTAGLRPNIPTMERSSNHPRQLDNAEAQMVTSMPIGFDIIPARAGDDLADSDAETSHRHDKPTG
ncbi:jg8964 [Pararge aegeria aegeria]|uniref:Jg8964 protein n=1 Tax=Pararge aegeria aegeria TaxID=348720 RepID=A0A8S4S6N3_9NEOP|nr:jg8964 [Pararge aegeria aegeria]